MNNITLYSTDCPKCKILEKKLTEKNIEFSTVTDVDKMIEMGMQIAPVLEVDGERMDFAKANQWVNGVKQASGNGDFECETCNIK